MPRDQDRVSLAAVTIKELVKMAGFSAAPHSEKAKKSGIYCTITFDESASLAQLINSPGWGQAYGGHPIDGPRKTAYHTRALHRAPSDHCRHQGQGQFGGSVAVSKGHGELSILPRTPVSNGRDVGNGDRLRQATKGREYSVQSIAYELGVHDPGIRMVAVEKYQAWYRRMASRNSGAIGHGGILQHLTLQLFFRGAKPASKRPIFKTEARVC
ncbi:hypothetical protein L209DRAFT_744768 [Thermothelomyces heterothallicus CBS 203.75]